MLTLNNVFFWLKGEKKLQHPNVKQICLIHAGDTNNYAKMTNLPNFFPRKFGIKLPKLLLFNFFGNGAGDWKLCNKII